MGLGGRPPVVERRPQRYQGGDRRREPALTAPRRADPGERPEQQTEIESADMDQEPFENVGMAAQMGAPHAPGFIEMRVGAFQPFAALPQQGQASSATNASPEW